MNYFSSYLLALISISLHELAHIITAALLKVKIHGVRVLAVGLNAIIDDQMISRSKKLLIYISGPLLNLILFIIGILAYKYLGFMKNINSKEAVLYINYKDCLLNFSSVNFCLAAFNLLPVEPLDGSRIFSNILESDKGIFIAYKCTKKVSVILSLIIIFAGIIQLLYSSFLNSSLLFIGVYITILNLLKRKKGEAAYMNMKQILYRRARLIKKGIYPVRNLAVMENMQMGNIIKSLDFDKFHIIYVLDEDLRIRKIYTEHEIINGIINNDSVITFKEFMNREETG